MKSRPVLAPPWVFYGAPYAPSGFWIRTDVCTATTKCPQCFSDPWEPCKSKGAWWSSTHWQRRKAAGKHLARHLAIEVRIPGASPVETSGYNVSLVVGLPPALEQEDPDARHSE